MSRLPVPRLVVIVDRETSFLPVVETAWAALDGGADQIQVREPNLDGPAVSEIIQQMLDAGIDRSRITINGWPDLAERFHVNLHLPERTADFADTINLGDNLWSRSVHAPLGSPGIAPFDYLVAGNVLPTASHPGRPGLGVGGFAEIVGTSDVPVLAIGGMTPDTLGPFIAAGAHGVVVRSWATANSDPRAAVRRIKDEVDKWTM